MGFFQSKMLSDAAEGDADNVSGAEDVGSGSKVSGAEDAVEEGNASDSKDVVEGDIASNSDPVEDGTGDTKDDGKGTAPVAGLGVDIIEIERMEKVLKRTPRFIERVFSETERSYAQQKTRPVVHFALFFAAKEAVLKALGTGFSGMAFTDVEIDHDRFGRPVPLLHGHARELAEKQGIVEMQLSLSYTHSVGVASAVAIKEQDRPRKDTKLDPRIELTRQFKEVRAILDEMDERLKDLEEKEAQGSQETQETQETQEFAGEQEAQGSQETQETRNQQERPDE